MTVKMMTIMTRRVPPMTRRIRLRMVAGQRIPPAMGGQGRCGGRAQRESSTTIERAARRYVSRAILSSAPGAAMSCGEACAVSMARYQLSLPCGTGARVNRHSVSDALNIMRMSLSSRSASISDLLPSIRRASVRALRGPVGALRGLGEPRDVRDHVVAGVLPAVELGPMERGMPHAEPDQLPAESVDVRVRREQAPVVPRDLVVLAPRVVVAPLRAAHLVPAQDHRGAEGEEQGGEEVLHLPVADRLDLRVIRGALHAVVRALIRGGPVRLFSPFSSLCFVA